MSVEVARNRGRPWTRELDELLLELDEAGATRERMAEVLGRTVAAVDAHLQELRQRLDRSETCRNCVKYNPAACRCYEWSKHVSPDQTCKNHYPTWGRPEEVVEERRGHVETTMNSTSIVWLESMRHVLNGRARQGKFVSIPTPGATGGIAISAELGETFATDGERVKVGFVAASREIWIKRDPEGPHRVTKASANKASRSLGSHVMAQRLREAGLPPGRYYMDEARSGKAIMVFVWRGEDGKK